MLIAIEGIDGSGKGTQAKMLLARARAEGLKAESISFPLYEDTFFGREVGRYLNGEFGALDAIHPKLTSLLYAGDRFEAQGRIRRLLEENDLVISDRYTPSNQAHQGVKLPESERAEFLEWLDELEFGVFGIPRPDRVLLLDLPAEIAAELVLQKAARSYTQKAADLHESDTGYLAAAHGVYHTLSKTPGWMRIPCTRGGELRTVDEIHEDVWKTVRALLEGRS